MLDYPEVVKAAFIHRYGDGGKLSSVQKMNLRFDVAKSLLAQKYSHLTSELERKATNQHDAEVDEWNLILDDVSTALDVPQYVFPLCVHHLPQLTHGCVCSARDTLFDAVHPLLQAIGSYANCYVSLIVGNADTHEPDGEFFTALVRSSLSIVLACR